MKRLLCLASLGLAFACPSLTAQTTFPYFTDFDDANAQDGWIEHRKGATGFDRWDFSTFQPFSSPNALTHFYPVGGTQLTVDWFVSPAFDFSIGGNIDSLRYAFGGFGTVMPGDTVALYLLGGAQDPDSATNVTLLYDFRDTVYQNDNVWRKLTDVNIPATSGMAYLAFKYVTTNNWLDVRFDNLALSGNGIGVPDPSEAEFQISLFPNPAGDYVSLKGNAHMGNEQLQLRLFDLNGRMLHEEWLAPNAKVDVRHLKGMLLYKLYNNKDILIGEGKVLKM